MTAFFRQSCCEDLNLGVVVHLPVVVNNESGPENVRAEVFDAIGHPTRIKILQVLHDNPMGFAELKRSVGIESSGNMSFHLNKLRYLVKSTNDGNYILTDAGKEALWSVGNISGVSKDQGADFQVKRAWKYRKRIIAILIVGLLALGVIVGLQQLQLSTQQQEISSQQQEIGLYVNQAHPFTIGQAASLIIGQKSFSSTTPATSRNGLYSPGEVLFDSKGNLWVEDYGNSRILEFKPPFSTGMNAFLVIGQPDFTTVTTTSETANELLLPGLFVFDSSGNLWVNDFGHNRVLEFEPPFHTDMSASLVIGQKNFTSGSPGLSPNKINHPAGLAFDSSNNLWLLDEGNTRVLEFRPPFTNGMNASLVIGQHNFQTSGYSTTQSGLSSGCVVVPNECRFSFSDLTFDHSGNLWVGDAGNERILEFEPPFSNGMDASLVIGQASFNSQDIAFNSAACASGQYAVLAYDGTGDLWASINCRLLEFQPPFMNDMQPSFELGQPDFTSLVWVGGPNGLAIPGKISFDASGNLWVPDYLTNRVLEFAAAGSMPLTPASWLQNYGELELIGIVGVLLVVGSMAAVSVRIKRSTNKLTA
jgi:sugar lactone lactonase YvrE